MRRGVCFVRVYEWIVRLGVFYFLGLGVWGLGSFLHVGRYLWFVQV